MVDEPRDVLQSSQYILIWILQMISCCNHKDRTVFITGLLNTFLFQPYTENELDLTPIHSGAETDTRFKIFTTAV